MNKIYLVGTEYTVFRPRSVTTAYETRAVCDSFEKAVEIKKQLEKESMKWEVMDLKIVIQEVLTNKCYMYDMISGSDEILDES